MDASSPRTALGCFGAAVGFCTQLSHGHRRESDVARGTGKEGWSGTERKIHRSYLLKDPAQQVNDGFAHPNGAAEFDYRNCPGQAPGRNRQLNSIFRMHPERLIRWLRPGSRLRLGYKRCRAIHFRSKDSESLIEAARFRSTVRRCDYPFLMSSES